MRNTYLQMCDYGSRFRILKGGKISLVISAFFAGVTLLHAAPSGGVVTSGTANIAQNGAVTTINQSSQKASINWTNFSIGASETVNFNQPNVSAIALNRVVGNEKSIVDGALNANGQVWILNSNGVLFNCTAKINTSGLLATTKSLSDEDFQTGNYIFKGESSASVINLGEVTINNGGYASFLANTAQNEGVIKAIRGVVTLTGANEAVINLNGNSLVSLKVNKGVLDTLVENKGAILAEGGKVYLTTNAVDELLKGVVNNTGIIEAKSIDDISSEVVLYAHGGTTNVSGTIDASGGFVETSGKNLSVADGTIVKAKKWLLDPTNVIVDDIGNGGTINATTIEANLAASSGEIEMQANGGDITVNQAINIFITNGEGYTAGGLVLTAGNDININNIITVGPEAYLSLNHGWNGTAYNGSNGADIYGHGGKITFGMNAAKTDFAGKVVFAPNENTPGFENSSIYINDVQQTLIRSVADLQALSDNANGVIGNSTDQANALKGNFVLAADIDMTGVLWTPIGKYKSSNNDTDYSLEFKGNFNGLGHTISNLTMNGDFTYNGDGQAAGLFGNIATTYDVQNQMKYAANISGIRLSNASVTNTYTHNNSTWNYIYSAQTAALVGAARDNSALVEDQQNSIPLLTPIIHNNIVTGSTVQSTGDGENVGGIVGQAQGIIISGNAVTDTSVISNNRTAGGIVGSASGSTITDSFVADSTIKSAYGYVGGVVGTMRASTIDGAMVKNSLIQADGTLQGSYGVGGIAGYVYEGSKIIDSASEGNTIAAMQNVGGIVGFLDDSSYDLESDEPSTVTNSFYNLNNTKIGINLANASSNPTGIITLGAVDSADYTTWLNAGKTTPSLTSVFGTAVNGYYTINNNADFRKMLAFAYDPNAKFKLASSFTLDNGLYLPLFMGEFDGNSKTITGLSVSQGYNSHIGLVGRLMGGTVKNLTLASPTLDGYAYVGGVAGYAGGGSYEMYDGEAQYSNFPTISNVTVNNFTYSHTKEFTVDTQNINTEVSNIGAVAGYIDGATLSNLLATGSITANLIANNYNELENSYSTVGIHDIGGLFGNMYNSSLNTASSSVAITAMLTNQTAHDSIETYDIGGLSGGAGNSIFQNTTASGNISITHANDDNGVSYAGSIGGAFGSIYNSYVKTSSTTNAITVSGAITEGIESVGGFAGDSGYSVYDTVSTSGVMNIIVTGNNVYSAGGLLGTSYNDIVKNVTSTRNITLSADYVEYIGGLIGGTEYSNIDMATYTGTLDLSSVNNGESVGGLVGYSYGEIDDHTQVYFSKVVSAATTPDNQAQIDAVKTALLTAFNARADVVALKAMGYTVEDNSWGNDNEPYYVKFNLKSPSMEWGVIQNATAIVDIKAPNVENVGGLVGYMDSYDGGQIINSSVASLGGTGKVLGGTNVGGLVGYNSYGNITDSHAAIEVVGNTDYDGSYVGGLVGYNEGGSRGQDVYPYIQDSYSYAELSFANQSDAEAKLAQIQDTFITNALATNPGYEMNYNGLYVAFDGTNYVVGGSLGLYKSTSTGTITNSYATGRVTGSSNVGGLVGYNYGEDGGAAITNSYASGVVVGTDNVGGLVGYNEYAMLDTVYATGTVNGNNKVGGLVGYATGSEIIDSHHTLGKVTGTENDSAEGGRIGGLVGLLEESSLSNSYATSEVVGETVVGGLVGMAMGSQIVDSYVTGKVTASGGTGNDLSTYGFDANEYISMAGGFVGIASQSSIENSYATGEVVGKGILGGFAGGLQVTEVSGSHATGKVTGTNGLGGFVGFSIISNISQSYSTGVVDATAATGVDSVTAGNMVGGFVARSVADNISESYTTSNVTGATNVGGFAGKVSTGTAISNTYARGSVTASGNNVGSFAGALDGSTVENSYASGKINQTGLNQLSVKGFVGNHDGDIINSFYNKTVNAGLTDDGSNVGKTTTELKTQSTYTTALGDGAWNMGGENGHYPILGFQVDGAESIWVMAEGPMPVDPTPTPVPTPTTPIVETPKIIDAIASGIAVQPPVVPNFTPPPLPSIPQQFSFGGQAVQLMSTPLSESPTQIISLGEIRQMQQENASGAEGVKSPDIRIPLGQNSLIQLVNGGLRLPEGIEQEFFMAQR